MSDYEKVMLKEALGFADQALNIIAQVEGAKFLLIANLLHAVISLGEDLLK